MKLSILQEILSMNMNLKRIKDRDKEGLILYDVSSMSHMSLIKKPLLTIENLGLIHNIDSASMLIFSFQEPDQMTQFLMFF